MNDRPAKFDSSWENLRRYPGIFEIGSNAESQLLDLRDHYNRENDERFRLRLRGGLEDEGVLHNDITDMRFQHVASCILRDESHPLLKMFDQIFIIELDRRLRFCRMVLAAFNLPDDFISRVVVEEDEPSWMPEHEADPEDEDLPRYDALDWILMSGHFYHAIPWFAAKILAHYRRVQDQLESRTPVHEADVWAVCRECMLLGETWEQARHVTNFGKHTLRGIKSPKSGLKGHEAVYGDQGAKNRRWAAMDRRVKELIEQGAPKMNAYADVAREFGVTADGVRGAIREFRKRKG